MTDPARLRALLALFEVEGSETLAVARTAAGNLVPVLRQDGETVAEAVERAHFYPLTGCKTVVWLHEEAERLAEQIRVKIWTDRLEVFHTAIYRGPDGRPSDYYWPPWSVWPPPDREEERSQSAEEGASDAG